jgi:hypothetical protein
VPEPKKVQKLAGNGPAGQRSIGPEGQRGTERSRNCNEQRKYAPVNMHGRVFWKDGGRQLRLPKEKYGPSLFLNIFLSFLFGWFELTKQSEKVKKRVPVI